MCFIGAFKPAFLKEQPSFTIVSLKLDFEPQKGGMAVSAVWRLACLLSPIPIGTKEHAKTHRRCLRLVEPTDRRDALCSSPKIQKQAAFWYYLKSVKINLIHS